jgi:hypothetical protein
MKTKHLPKLGIFKYEFVMVYWVDIESDAGWRSVEDVTSDYLPVCISSGWLIKRDRKVTRLVSDFNVDSAGKVNEVGSSTIIPTCVIQKIIKIKL